jgi:hypothetical protein
VLYLCRTLCITNLPKGGWTWDPSNGFRGRIRRTNRMQVRVNDDFSHSTAGSRGPGAGTNTSRYKHEQVQKDKVQNTQVQTWSATAPSPGTKTSRYKHRQVQTRAGTNTGRYKHEQVQTLNETAPGPLQFTAQLRDQHGPPGPLAAASRASRAAGPEEADHVLQIRCSQGKTGN